MLKLRQIVPWFSGILVIGLAVVSSAPTFALRPGDEYWADGFNLVGADSRVLALLPTAGGLFAGGDFLVLGEAAAPYVARWDGLVWHGLGGGLDSTVYSLAEWNGDLIVGGAFQHAGGVPASGIACWDGTAWHALGSGSMAIVRALAVYDGDLIASGNFSADAGPDANRIARWDGANWEPLGSGLGASFDYPPNALIRYNGGLVAAGQDAMAHWDGISWSDPYGLPGYYGTSWISVQVFGLAIYDGQLFAVGDFVGDDYLSIARWDGQQWQGLNGGLWGSPSPTGDVTYASAAGVYGGDLVVGGFFLKAGAGIDVSGIARWNGSYWSVASEGLREFFEYEPPPVSSIVSWDGQLFIGGLFHELDGDNEIPGGYVRVQHVATWTGGGWGPVGMPGDGLDGAVHDIRPYGNGFVVTGDFSHTGGLAAAGIAYREADTWYALGGGLAGGYGQALAVWNGDLIAGGTFTEAGGSAAHHVARWDGQGWGPMGEGLIDDVNALEVYDGELWAEGFRWDGASWVDELQTDGPIYALLSWDGNLYAAGRFVTSGDDTVNGILRWDGGVVHPLGSGLPYSNRSVTDLDVYQGELLASGNFYSMGGVDAHYLALWDGSGWHPVSEENLHGGYTYYGVYSVAVNGNQLLAGGRFAEAGDLLVNMIARWDGSQWHDLGSGLHGDLYGEWSEWNVHALEVQDGNLLVGGDFLVAGGKPAANFGVWSGLSLTGVSESGSAGFKASALQAAPNPFNPSTTIDYEVPAPVAVRLRIYDLRGLLVTTLVDRPMPAGRYQAHWDGRDMDGRELASGVYLARLEAGSHIAFGRITLVR